jgi:hypothetical protein
MNWQIFALLRQPRISRLKGIVDRFSKAANRRSLADGVKVKQEPVDSARHLDASTAVSEIAQLTAMRARLQARRDER